MKPLTLNLLAAAIASACAMLPQPASAAQFPLLFSRDAAATDGIPAGEVREQMQGIAQVRLRGDATASFVGRARYRLREDGDVELHQGSVTVATGDAGNVIRVHMPQGVVGEVAGRGAVASFSVAGGESRGHVLEGGARIGGKAFAAQQFWKAGANGRVERVIAMGAQATPDAGGEAVSSLREGGAVAAAIHGFPTGFADALAASGAAAELVDAARRAQASAANPSLASFPSGDYALLVAHAARLSAPYGDAAFPGASADIVRSYLRYLADGGSGAEFLTVYARLMTQYVDLVRSGADPASFAGASQADILAFLSYQQRVNGFAALGADNRVLLEAYLTFLRAGGLPSAFVSGYTDLVTAYFQYLRGGGRPTDFAGATQDTLKAYLEFLSGSNLLVRLPAGDQALLQAYLASLRAGGSGFDFGAHYGEALIAFRAFLEAGHAPSDYTTLDLATLRNYMATLDATGLLELYLGESAGFYRELLAYLNAGGAIDLFPGLPSHAWPQYADALRAFHAYLADGGLPADYGALDGDTLLRYLRLLIESGRLEALLGDQAAFLRSYYEYIVAGHPAELFPQLPVYARYEEALRAYYAWLMAGGKPSDYTALTLAQIRAYIEALERAGLFALRFEGDIQTFLRNYYAWLASGGDPDLFADLPHDPPPPVAGKVQISTAMNMPGYIGKNYASSTTSPEDLSVDGNKVPNGSIPGGDFSIPAGATAHEVKNTDHIHIGRLTNATFARHNGSYALGPNQGLHYGYVSPLANIPTSGVVNYTLVGATNPTWSSGALSPGNFEGRLAIAFGASEYRVAIQGQITMPGDTYYTFSTPGGVDAVATQGTAQGNQYAFGWVPMSMAGTGRACSAGASCGLETNYQLGGEGGAGLTLTYLSYSNNASDDAFAGAVGFHKGAATPPPASADPWINRSIGNALVVGLTNDSPAWGLFNGMAPENVAFDPLGALKTLSTVGRDDTAGASYVGKSGHVLAWSRWGVDTVIKKLSNGERVDNAGTFFSSIVIAEPYKAIAQSGRIDYTLVGGVNPMRENGAGARGMLEGRASVYFGSEARIGFDMTVKMSDASYNILTPGFANDPNLWLKVMADGRFGGAGTWTMGADCVNGCYTTLNGSLAGIGGSHVALLYRVVHGSGDARNIAGLAAFAKEGWTPTPAAITAQALQTPVAPTAPVAPSAGWQRWQGPTPHAALQPVVTRADAVHGSVSADATDARDRLERLFNGGIQFQP